MVVGEVCGKGLMFVFDFVVNKDMCELIDLLLGYVNVVVEVVCENGVLVCLVGMKIILLLLFVI